jgi:cytochrome c
MKKIIVVLTAAFVFACNNAADKTATNNTDTASKKEAADAGVPPGLTRAEYDKALQLIASSDCLTCHKIEEKLTGPAYKEVAQKYEPTDANINMLAQKIIKGGSGNWGQVPMTPHDSISVDDAKTMVKYILALKNAK